MFWAMTAAPDIRRQCEFLGCDLRHRRHDSLTEFDLGGERAHDARLAEVEPVTEPRIFLQAPRQPRFAQPDCAFASPPRFSVRDRTACSAGAP